MKTIYLIVLFVTTAAFVQAQNAQQHGNLNIEDRHLTGIIIDEKTKEKLEHGTIAKVMANKKQWKPEILTDKKGHFHITFNTLDRIKYPLLEFNYIGYQTKFIAIDTLKSDTIVVEMKESLNHHQSEVAAKPVIYLYPQQKTEITVQHDYKGKILNTYPKYDGNWHVIAEPTGVLYNIKDKRTYNYLFWDGEMEFPASHFNYKTGFYVKNDDLIPFFQEKLAKIGLNNTETNEFITYWLPVLSKNAFNFIHFRINDNIDNSSFLTIQPRPDAELRVFMQFKALDNIDSADPKVEQEFTPFVRKGFTMVEWGGGEIAQRRAE